MKNLKVDLDEVVYALTSTPSEMYAYLDTQTGEVILVTIDAREGVEDFIFNVETFEEAVERIKAMNLGPTDEPLHIDAAKIALNEDQYLMIPSQDTREDYEDIEDFVGTIADENLRDTLSEAIRGKGAFRRFRNTLERHPDVEKEWYAFKDTRARERVIRWLNSEEINPE